ncbi:MAG: hypothetical protein KDJ52_09635 [Anaerolineae bacterium]|nr:hypothetical protein [Anaerolineae bacterium]
MAGDTLKTNRLRWIGLGAVTAMLLIVALLWLWPDRSPLPADSMLTQSTLPSDLLDNLGLRASRQPRTNYSHQQFENGVMLWWDNPDSAEAIIFVIPNGNTRNQGNDWSRYKNSWSAAADPVFPPDCPEAKDPFGPMMGFSLFTTKVKAKVKAEAKAEAENDVSGDSH